MIFKILDLLLVSFCGGFGLERTEIAALAGLFAFLTGIDAVFPGS